MLNKALIIASGAHNGQKDRAGVNYMIHVLTVMHNLGPSADEELRCIALLHDVVEDTDWTLDDLLNLGFSERVLAGVKAVTKVSGQSLEEYKVGIFANEDAMRVKKADLMHNSDLSRLGGKVTEKDLERNKKYLQFIAEIDEKMS